MNPNAGKKYITPSQQKKIDADEYNQQRDLDIQYRLGLSMAADLPKRPETEQQRRVNSRGRRGIGMMTAIAVASMAASMPSQIDSEE